MTPASANEASGSWDSIHVFETVERGRQAHYKLTSTVMLQLVTRSGNSGSAPSKEDLKKGPEGLKTDGEVTLSGSMTRQTEQDWPLTDATSHITNTGKMIEEMEIKMRSLLQEVYPSSTRGHTPDLTASPAGLLWQDARCRPRLAKCGGFGKD